MYYSFSIYPGSFVISLRSYCLQKSKERREGKEKCFFIKPKDEPYPLNVYKRDFLGLLDQDKSVHLRQNRTWSMSIV